jgi:hypothetical protein
MPSWQCLIVDGAVDVELGVLGRLADHHLDLYRARPSRRALGAARAARAGRHLCAAFEAREARVFRGDLVRELGHLREGRGVSD